jgi:putative zinc finger/helix-turn-helix YgiT family protein
MKPARCPVCGKADLRSLLHDECFDYEADGERVTVAAKGVPIERCPDCGETFSGPPAWQIRGEAIRQALGLLSPTEVVVLRERLGLSQLDFAKLTGIAEAKIVDWKLGRLVPSRAMDNLLRLLAATPDGAKLLQRNGSLVAAHPAMPRPVNA